MTMNNRPLNILQVEDTRSDVVLTAHALKSAGIPHSIRVAADGKEAIALLNRDVGFEHAIRPDLILLDLSLPGINGHEVLEFIKAHETLRTIPVVIFTTLASEESQVRAYRNNANSYVLKPLDLESFTAIVQSIASYWGQTSTIAPINKSAG